MGAALHDFDDERLLDAPRLAPPPLIAALDIGVSKTVCLATRRDPVLDMHPHRPLRISGVGDKKLREFGAVFMGEITSHLGSNPRQMFADDSFAAPAPFVPMRSKLTDTVRDTLHYFRQGKSVAEIAHIRGVVEGTIYGHLETAMQAGETIDVDSLVSAEAQREIAAAFEKHGFGSLGRVVESLGGRYGYGPCRLVRAAMQRM